MPESDPHALLSVAFISLTQTQSISKTRKSILKGKGKGNFCFLIKYYYLLKPIRDKLLISYLLKDYTKGLFHHRFVSEETKVSYRKIVNDSEKGLRGD